MYQSFRVINKNGDGISADELTKFYNEMIAYVNVSEKLDIQVA
jgi:hypothetical protein